MHLGKILGSQGNCNHGTDRCIKTEVTGIRNLIVMVLNCKHNNVLNLGLHGDQNRLLGRLESPW